MKVKFKGTKFLMPMVVALLAVLLLLPVAGTAKEFKLPPFIPIATYDVGSSAYRTTAMATEAITEHSGQKFRLLPASTDTARMSALRSGAVPILTIGGGATFASAGRAEFAEMGWGPQDVNIVWCPAITGITLMVRGDSGLKSVADLKGKKVAYVEGSPGLNVQITAHLAFAGLTWKDVEVVNVPSYAAGCEGVISGLLDAAITVPTASFARRLEASKYGIGYIALPFNDEAGWKKAAKVYPFWAKYKATNGAGVSPEKPLMCATYANPIAITMANQDPDLIYWYVKNLAESYPIYAKKSAVMKENWTVQWCLDLINNTAIPVHPGAIRYWKEVGKWTPAMDKRNQELIAHKQALVELWRKALTTAGKKAKGDGWVKYWQEVRTQAGPEFAW